MSKNPFIVIESLDGAGGSTQTDLLTQALKKEKPFKIHFPQEDRSTGRLIYDKFLLTKNKLNFSKREQSLLYISDFHSRAEIIHTIQQGKEEKHKVVISDRFCTSTFAYQTMGLTGEKRKKMLNWLFELTYKANLPKPDIVILLDLPVEISISRLKALSHKKDYFENKTRLTAIRNSYLKIAKQQKWHVVSCVDEEGNARSKADIHSDVLSLVLRSRSK